MTNYPDTEVWITTMARAAGQFGLSIDVPALRQQMRWYESLPLLRRLECIGGMMGLQISTSPAAKTRWRNELLPVIAQLQDGSPIVLESMDADGNVTYWLGASGNMKREVALDELLTRLQPDVILLGIADRGKDARIDEFIRPYQQHWFWQHFRHAGRQLGEISLASVVGNVLALGAFCFPCRCMTGLFPLNPILRCGCFFGRAGSRSAGVCRSSGAYAHFGHYGKGRRSQSLLAVFCPSDGD